MAASPVGQPLSRAESPLSRARTPSTPLWPGRIGQSPSTPGIPITVDWTKLMSYNLDEFPEMDPSAEVASPRSLEACKSEGIRPEDLSYVPIEAFMAVCDEPEIVRLRYEFFEARRQDMLRLARRARTARIEKAPPRTTLSMDDPREAYPHTLAFFRKELQAIEPNMPICEADWTAAPRTEEFKPLKPFNPGASGGITGSASGGASGGIGEFLGGSLSSTLVGADTSWRSAASEEYIPELLRTLNEAPGSDWKEHDMVRRLENNLITLRENEQKRVRASHSEQARLTDKRVKGLGASFERLCFEQKRNARYREIRHYMAPPPGVAGNTEGQQRSRDHLFLLACEAEGHKQEHMRKVVEKKQDLELKQMERHYMEKVRYSHHNVEDRLRWRYNYASVMRDVHETEEGILENSRRRQAQIDAVSNRAAADTTIKNELMNLRNTARTLNEFIRRRKDTYQDESQRSQKKKLAEMRLHRTHGSLSLPNLF